MGLVPLLWGLLGSLDDAAQRVQDARRDAVQVLAVNVMQSGCPSCNTLRMAEPATQLCPMCGGQRRLVAFTTAGDRDKKDSGPYRRGLTATAHIPSARATAVG